MKPTRTQRLNSEIQREVAEIVTLLKTREPGLKGIVSITGADVAPDLKTAKIFVSIYAGEEDKKQGFEILRENAGFFRHELAQRMTMRTVPALSFYEDGSMEYGSKMDALFAELNKEEK